MADETAGGGKGGKFGFLTHKLGPLPVWAYALIAVGAYYWYSNYGPGKSATTAAAAAGAAADPSTGVPYDAELAAANQQLADQANAADGSTGNDLGAGGDGTTTPPGGVTVPPIVPAPDPGTTSPPPVIKHQESFFAKAKADLIAAGNKNPTLREIELKRNELRKKAGDKPLPVVAKKPIRGRKTPVPIRGHVNPGGPNVPVVNPGGPDKPAKKPAPVHKPTPIRKAA